MQLKPLSLAVRLRPYQSDLLEGVYGSWEAGVQNVMAVSPTGSGKTVLFSAALSQHCGAAVAIAHRQELVGQIAAALNRVGVRFRIIAPKPVRALIIKAILTRQKVCHYDPTAEIGVASVQSLKNVPTSKQYAADRTWLNRIGLWVTDECFPAGTVVSGKPIEAIRPGEYVDAFDERSGRVVPRKVLRTFKNPAPLNMVRIRSAHHVLECTPTHPIFTSRGWVPAIELNESDEVLIERKRMPLVRRPGGRTDRLAEKLLPQDGSVVLQPGVLEGVSSRSIEPDDGHDKPQVRFSSDESQEPYAAPGGSGGHGEHLEANEALPRPARGQWQAGDGRREGPVLYAESAGFQAADRCEDSRVPRPRRLPLLLQAGYRAHRPETGGRGGRLQPLLSGAESAGREERAVLERSRVDSIEVYQRKDSDGAGGSGLGDHVYNLEVEGLHTYIANGVVVHNCHHLQADNIWGAALGLFPPTVRGLGVTATPIRGDGGGLGKTSDGVFDQMVEGPSPADLIEKGYLTPFKVVCAPVKVDYSEAKVGPSGEYVNARLVALEEASGLTGDIVETYLKYTPEKLGLAFVSSVKRAHDLAAAFTERGVPAAAISGSTPDDERAELIRKLEARELLVLTNVDVASEGTDLPAVEVVIMGTKTASLSRYLQWAGRGLRLMVDYSNYDDLTDAQRRQRIAESEKPFAWLIDHANNIVTHGLPDKPHIWSLEGGSSSGASDSDAIPLRACTNPGLTLVKPGIGWDAWRKAGWTNEQLLEHGHATETGIPCAQPYEAFLRCCEFCGYMPEPKGRRDPAEVEGDLELLDEDTMAAIRASYLEARQSIEHYRSAIAAGEHGRMNHLMASANVNRHREKLEALAELDDAMARFGGKYRARGESDTQIQRRFYATFGIDVLTAASLKRADAEKLRGKIDNLLNGA